MASTAGIGPRYPKLRLVRGNLTSKQSWEDAIFPDAANLRESVISSYQAILSTRRGERVMNPTFGLDPSLVEFEQADEQTTILGTEMLSEALAAETRATVLSITPSLQANSNQIAWSIYAKLHSLVPQTIMLVFTP